ncbi:MAG: flagellar M-ring protein FliF [Lentisphaerae bacterium RIFOXYA12_FULL_48_11]|nr:MAG: flagellar M-ring protein FliF [Lentisphaerae bacterium RIFOXYA12_FULL_48_11]
MENSLKVLGKQLGEIWHHFGVNQKTSVILAMLITVGAIGGMLYWSSMPSFRLVYAGLSLEDAAKAAEKLEESKIKVKIGDSGHAIYVPEKDVYKCRLTLASEGIPKSTSAGFELFEQPKFGLTDFAQKINYQRALQGELERTISSIEGISSARVMLVLPADKIFSSQSEKKASASIMVTVASGNALNSAQVRSIKQLVSSAVSGLNPTAIAVTDQYGHLLAQRVESDADGVEGEGTQIETQDKMESMLTKKAQDMLDMALGMGKSIVKVSANLDFSKVERRKESYESEGRVAMSETISSETTSTPGSGQTATVPVSDPSKVAIDQGMGKSKKEDTTTQYKVPGGIETVVEKGARIKSLSVSVCVATGVKPRTPEDILRIQSMVENAVGAVKTEARIDAVKVVEMDFPQPAKVEGPAFWQKLPISLSSIGNGVFSLILLIVIILVSRKIFAGLSLQREDVGVPIKNLYGAGVSSVGESGGGKAPILEGEPTIEQVSRLAEDNPKAVAAWITSVSASHK